MAHQVCTWSDQTADLRSVPMPEIVAAYLRIASDLRSRIASGALPPGAKLPSETQIMAEYGVSRTVAKYAINVLKGDGLVEGRPGSGVYVREVLRLTRESQGHDQRHQPGSTSPFARDAARAGTRGGWEHHSEHTTANADVARRLGIEVGEPVMRTSYRFLADGLPIQLSISWEPLAITRGTPVEWPEDGAAVGVVTRMDSIGVHIDRCVERVSARPAHPDEIVALALPMRGAYVLVIERTYYVGDLAVEIADIVLTSRYEVVYRYPID